MQRQTTIEIAIHFPQVLANMIESYILYGKNPFYLSPFRHGFAGHWEIAMSMQNYSACLAFDGACEGNNEELAFALLDKIKYIELSHFKCAIDNNNVRLITHIIKMKYQSDYQFEDALDSAACRCDIKMCELLLSLGVREMDGCVIKSGVRHGRFDMIALSIKHGTGLTKVKSRNVGRCGDWGIMLLFGRSSFNAWRRIAFGIAYDGNARLLKRCIALMRRIGGRENMIDLKLDNMLGQICRSHNIGARYYECTQVLFDNGVDQCSHCDNIEQHRTALTQFIMSQNGRRE